VTNVLEILCQGVSEPLLGLGKAPVLDLSPEKRHHARRIREKPAIWWRDDH
jgi:hypothetical protein